MRLIYLSPLPWNSFIQRPHELVRYFHAQTGGEVLWIDPYPTRFPQFGDVLRRRPAAAGMDGAQPDWLTLIQPQPMPIEPLPFSGAINGFFWRAIMAHVARFQDGATILGIGKPSALGLRLLSQFAFASSFYDAMDDFPAFYSGWSKFSMADKERKTARRVSTLLTSSSPLQQRFQHVAPDVRLVRNACATERLPSLSSAPRRQDIGRPVIGYIGTIAQWFDWELVLALAAAQPAATVRLIGPVYRPPPGPLPKNVFLEAPLPHAAALQAMMHFDIGLIPFKKNALTAAVDPIKYYEYRALGLPVVSSAFGEMALRGESDGVWNIENNTDMKKVMTDVFAAPQSSLKLDQFRKNNSWKSRFDAANLFVK